MDSGFSWVGILVIGIFVVAYILWQRKTGGTVTTGERGRRTPTLESFCIDATQRAREGKIDPVIGRSEEIERVTQILSRRTKNNPVLLGEPGVGKTAIAEGLALKIAQGEVPDILKEKRVLKLDVAELMAGTKYRGEFEQRVKKLVNEIRSAGRGIILFIDELHTVMQSSGTEGAINFSDILKPALARGELQLIGATTINEYEKFIKPDESLERRFQPVMVDEPTVDEAIEILKGLRENYENYHKVRYTDEALVAAARWSFEYIKGRTLPDKAIDVIDEAAAMVKVRKGENHESAVGILHGAAKNVTQKVDTAEGADLVVGIEDIREVVSEWSGHPKQEIH